MDAEVALETVTENGIDGLLDEDRGEMSERVAHLEKRVRDHQDEIICLKGALADVTRRLTSLETAKTQNSILPSKHLPKSPRRAPSGQERPKSFIESSISRPGSASHRPTPRGASAASIDKKWGSMSNSLEETNGHRGPRSAQLSHANIKEPTWNDEDGYLRMHLKGRPISLYAPSGVVDYDPKAQQKEPKEELELEWVYGYRGRDARSNLYMLPTGEILYFTAGVVVLHNVETQTQRFYLKHTDDIKCITIHPDKVRVASGQVAGHDKKDGKPHVRVWDSVSLNTLHVFGEGDFQRGVCCLSFSKLDGGKYLVAVDESDNHKMSVWDVSRENKASKVSEMKASGDPVTQCEWNPYVKDQIVCCGKSQISFWTVDDKIMDKKTGIFGNLKKPKVVICFAFAENGEVVSGDSDGNICVWERGDNRIREAVTNVHTGGVFSLCVTKDGKMLSGGKDRKIIEWDSEYKKTSVETEIPELYGAVRMISEGPGTTYLVGTIRNCILRGNFEIDFIPLVQGHKDEIWGLDCAPRDHFFITCGYDGYIYCWNSQAHAFVWSKEVASESSKDSTEADLQPEQRRRRKDGAHCVSIHPDQKVAVVGMQVPRWIVVDLETHETIGVYHEGKEQGKEQNKDQIKEQVECIQFNKAGDKLAVGSRDNYIYIYRVEQEGRKYKKIGRCSGHSSFVTHVDWSVDGNFVCSNSGDYEVLYWDANRCKQETDMSQMRDVEWATNNCTLTFNSIGVWPDNADGSDINGCSRAHERPLIVSGDDFGKVNLLEYPSIQPRAKQHSYHGHSSHVTRAKFVYDDSRVCTTGGKDATVLQWQVV